MTIIRYLERIPTENEVPEGEIVVHNQVRHAGSRLGNRGFRAWTQEPSFFTVECGCGWAPKLPAHYRIERHNSPPQPSIEWEVDGRTVRVRD